jgi:ABC-type lipoprotein release transport system permease subunit
MINAGLLTLIIEIFNQTAYKFEYILGGLIVLYNLTPHEYIFLAIVSMVIGLLASYYAASQSLKKIEKNY